MFCTREPWWLARVPQQEQDCPARGSKISDFSPAQPRRAKTRRSAGKAAASEDPRRYQPHFVWAVHPFNGSWRTGKPFQRFQHRESLSHVEGLNDASTRMGESASLGEEAVSADSWREGEISAGVGRVRKVTSSASCYSGTRISIHGGLSSIMSEKRLAVLLAGTPGKTAPRRI